MTRLMSYYDSVIESACRDLGLCKFGWVLAYQRDSSEFEGCQFLLKSQPSNIEVKAGREGWRWRGNESLIGERKQWHVWWVPVCPCMSPPPPPPPPLSRAGMTGQREDASRGSQISKYHPSYDQYWQYHRTNTPTVSSLEKLNTKFNLRCYSVFLVLN